MPKARQITVSIENRPGILGAVASALGARKVNIVAFMAIEGQDAIRLIVDKPAAAKKVFAERREPQVIAVLTAKSQHTQKPYREEVSARAVSSRNSSKFKKGVAYASVFFDARSALANL